jgi:hypothetical protein
MTLRAEEVLRRFLLHLLPRGLKRIRHYGLLANCHCEQRCRAPFDIRCTAIQSAGLDTSSRCHEDDADSLTEPTPTAYPVCGKPMRRRDHRTATARHVMIPSDRILEAHAVRASSRLAAPPCVCPSGSPYWKVMETIGDAHPGTLATHPLPSQPAASTDSFVATDTLPGIETP